MRRMSISLATFKRWLPLAFAVTFLFAFIYLLDQQDLRMGANDPQVTIGIQIFNSLEKGASPALLVNSNSVDIAQSLSTYVLLYDKEGKPIAGNGLLDGTTPTPPKGVFDYLRTHGEDRFTWQPRVGVRQAMVAFYYGGTNPVYIFIGRSLQEVEVREDWLTRVTAGAWATAISGSLFFSFVTS